MGSASARVALLGLCLILGFAAHSGSSVRKVKSRNMSLDVEASPERPLRSFDAAAGVANLRASPPDLGAGKNDAFVHLRPPAAALAAVADYARTSLSPHLKSLFAGLSFAASLKVACMAGNIFYTVSPIPQVQGWEYEGCTGNVDAAPYVTMALNGWQWCFYGFAAWLIKENDSFLVLVYANCLAAMLGIYYTSSFYRFCHNQSTSSNLKQYLSAAVALLLLETSIWLTLPHVQALMLHSIIASLCSFVSAMSVLAALPTVMRTHDTSAICAPLVLANLIGGFLWAYWGYTMMDCSILVPNLFAASASCVCLAVRAAFSPTSPDVDRSGRPDKMGRVWGISEHDGVAGGQ